MADFQSSKTAAEIEEVLTGAVLFNRNTKLTEAQKAQARANIGATSYGEGIKIISHFDTLAELEAAVQSPNAGDAYSVGLSLPYSLYLYDSLQSEWRNYGTIRSTDISARFAQNIAVDVAAWEEDTDVFVDYTYKAAISIGEVTGNDFPIVAFSPSDAVGGNFCPIAYSFDGYVEIWAKAIPTEAISIPAITFIVQSDGAEGNSTKGITNAGGGIATGGIGTEQIADGSITPAKLSADAKSSGVAVTLTVDGWADNVQTVAVDGVTANNNLIVSAAPDCHDEYGKCLVRSTAQAEGTLTFTCTKPPENDLVANVLIIP